MNLVVKMEFGSLVYGTSLPTSDTDFKQVYIPDARDILLGRVKKAIVETTKEDIHAKNKAEDVDIETFSLDKFLHLVSEGQTVAMDMLYVPKKHILESSEVWELIQANRDKLVHKQCTSFIGYAKTQANRYGIRGSRVAAVRGFLETIKGLDDESRLSEHIGLDGSWSNINAYLRTTEHCSITDTPSGPLIEVCNRKCPAHNKVKVARELYTRIFEEYGKRSLEAEANAGVDWKSLGHAVRICQQGCELLDTGNITFPRPNADFLLKIRTGQLPYNEVAKLIEDGLDELEKKVQTSTLRAEPDKEFVDNLVTSVYAQEVIDFFGE